MPKLNDVAQQIPPTEQELYDEALNCGYSSVDEMVAEMIADVATAIKKQYQHESQSGWQ